MSELAELTAKQEWLDPASRALRSAIDNVFQGETGRTVKDALNGVWLGHPLHPVLTDLPVGAWTMAEVFDAMDAASGGSRYEEAARVCINAGLVGAAGAAVTGLTDWSDTGQEDRRMGLVHAMLNVTATSLFVASTLLRRRRRTPGATRASAAGYAFAMAGAYLGGALVYKRRIGTDHAVQGDAPEGFVRTIRFDEIPDGDKRKIKVGDADVVLVRQGERICALAERCAHLGGPLSEGEVRDGTIICPWHQSQYALADGHVVHGPSTYDQPCYAARISGGFVEVKLG
ncbi:MAG: hypothetical protein V7647_853 [Acidobacteriota bacterium]|jgi:nitrite reductase/ring-hydroxylating ferredoxin subunit/uncharacterized membrane protein